MDLCRKFFCIVILILLNNTKICLYGAPAEGSIINTELNGKELLKMGKLLNKPLLSLLGATFVKTEQNMNRKLSEKISASEKNLKEGIDVLKNELCKQTQCSAWTKWSSCSAYMFNTFGARTRSKTCGNNSICFTKSTETVEKDYQICEGTCQHKLTNNNYCIKLYNSVKKTQTDAKDDCHKDGGHLMNIDSAIKAQDIWDYFNNISFSSDVWIDGTRTLPNGDWKYEYGSKETTYSIWYGSEPGSKDNCKVFSYNYNKWFGRKCENSQFALCEIF